MPNSDKIILDLCGGTGAWSKPYRDAGYDVRLITLPDNDVRTYTPPDKVVYGILAAPPCNEFSIAKGSRPRDFDSGLEVVLACFRIIWKCQVKSKLRFWAMENPVGFLRRFIGIPHFTFKLWEFGDNRIKPSDLWGYFNDPVKIVFTKPHLGLDLIQYGPSNLSYKEQSIWRQTTQPGFARAFFKANR